MIAQTTNRRVSYRVSFEGLVVSVAEEEHGASGSSIFDVLGLGDADPVACELQIWLASVAGTDVSTWTAYADDPPRVAAGLQLSYRPVLQEQSVVAVEVSIEGPSVATGVEQPDGAAEASPAFLADVRALVADCESALCRLQREPGARFAADALFRALHTLKGNALAANQRRLADVAHHAEEYLSPLPERGEAMSSERLAALADAVGHLRARFAAFARPQSSDAPTGFDRIDTQLVALRNALRDGGERVADAAADLRAAVAVLGDSKATVAAVRVCTAIDCGSEPAPALEALENRIASLRGCIGMLVRCPLPIHFVDELETCCAELDLALGSIAGNGATTAGFMDVLRAIADMRANADAFAVERARQISELAQAVVDGLPDGWRFALEQERDAARELATELRPVALAIGVPTEFDALGAFLAEARLRQANLAADVQEWLSNPRDVVVRTRLRWNARAYSAAARRWGLRALHERAVELARLLETASTRRAPRRASIARADQLIDDLGQHQELYRALQAELGGDGAAAQRAGFSALRAAWAAGDAALVRVADELGAVSLRKQLAVESSIARERVARAMRDASGFMIASCPPPEPAPAIASSMASAGRTLADRLGKDVRIEVDVADIPFDGAVARALTSALSHGIRNALDHGVETAQERVALGKDPRACIALRVEHADGGFRALLSDDGRGVNRENVIARAVARRLLSEEEAEAIADDELVELLFKPGFSTAATVTEVSGRGVGLDAVRELVATAGGSTRLFSCPGRGCTLELLLPARGMAERAPTDVGPCAGARAAVRVV